MQKLIGQNRPKAEFFLNSKIQKNKKSGGGGWFYQIYCHGNVNISLTKKARTMGVVSFKSTFQVDYRLKVSDHSKPLWEVGMARQLLLCALLKDLYQLLTREIFYLIGY